MLPLLATVSALASTPSLEEITTGFAWVQGARGESGYKVEVVDGRHRSLTVQRVDGSGLCGSEYRFDLGARDPLSEVGAGRDCETSAFLGVDEGAMLPVVVAVLLAGARHEDPCDSWAMLDVDGCPTWTPDLRRLDIEVLNASVQAGGWVRKDVGLLPLSLVASGPGGAAVTVRFDWSGPTSRR